MQQRICTRFCEKNGFEVVEILAEIASGKDDSRPIFNRAVERCKNDNLVLVAAKICRLARRILTVGKLIDSGISLRVVNLGNQPISKMVLAVFSAMAEVERDFISMRTSEALAHLKANGVKLGSPCLKSARSASLQVRRADSESFKLKMSPIIRELQEDGVCTLQQIANSLNLRGYKARRGGKFYPSTVRSILVA